VCSSVDAIPTGIETEDEDVKGGKSLLCMSCMIIASLQPLALNMLKGLLQKFRSREIGKGN